MIVPERWADDEYRLLVVAPTGRDAVNSVAVLTRAGLRAAACRDISELCRTIEHGVGAVLLTEEAFALDAIELLLDALRAQPPWSDLPVLLLTRGGPESGVAVRAMDALGNVIVLERPVRVRTLVTAATSALRGREKQYLVRSHLAEMQRADRRKDEFLATLAHELRNPLAPLRTGLHVLRAELGLSGTASRVSDMMERQLGHMVRLIDDLMDLSRITRGKTELRRERIDLRQVLDSAVETSTPAIDQAGHTLAVRVPPTPLPVDGDPTRLAQVVSNLLNNAAKYTPAGGHIVLSAEVVEKHVEIRVSDNGIGIPPEMLGNVFDMFIQVGRSIDRAQGGLGIGLTLVRSLVEMHGGSVAAHSDGPGHGSTFTIRLPLATTRVERRSAPRDPPSSPGAGARVLVVDDNEDAAESLSLYLAASGYETRVANDGAAALEVAQLFRPQVVFLDLGLPAMSGYEVARRLRRAGSDAVLIALTGWGSAADKERSRDAGFAFHLTKPADLGELQQILAQLPGGVVRRTSGLR